MSQLSHKEVGNQEKEMEVESLPKASVNSPKTSAKGKTLSDA